MKENQISGWVSLVFARKQMFNPRPITKRDKKGKSIWLISIGFPASSEYYGWYINVPPDAEISKSQEDALLTFAVKVTLFPFSIFFVDALIEALIANTFCGEHHNIIKLKIIITAL